MSGRRVFERREILTRGLKPTPHSERQPGGRGELGAAARTRSGGAAELGVEGGEADSDHPGEKSKLKRNDVERGGIIGVYAFEP